MVLGCALALPAGAQTAPQPNNSKSDWRVVEALQPGTPISVRSGGRWHRCNFDYADDASLKCWKEGFQQRLTAATMAARSPVFRREDVKTVRLEREMDATPIGAAAGVGLGVLGGALRGNSGGYTQSGEMMGLGLIGGVVGGVTGHVFPIGHHTVIYERP